MFMGRDSRSNGRGFESRYRILDVYLKRPKINEKEAGVGPFFKNKVFLSDAGSHETSYYQLK